MLAPVAWVVRDPAVKVDSERDQELGTGLCCCVAFGASPFDCFPAFSLSLEVLSAGRIMFKKSSMT